MKKNLSWFSVFIFVLFFVCLSPVYAQDGYDGESGYYDEYEGESEVNSTMFTILGAIVGGVGGTAALVSVQIKKHRPVRIAVDADSYITTGETKMTTAEDEFLRTATTKKAYKK